ncbi:MAG TPA: DoxX family protein [Rhodanobacteraceae bacterium]|nr:DoxX family protein [Rhodanobacteraceae bacterium]
MPARLLPLKDTFMRNWAPLLLRMVIGFGFMAHGWAKLSRGPDKFAGVLVWIGVPFPHFMAWLTTLTELVTGFAMFIGAFVALASIPMVIILLVAMLTVHLQYGFSSINTIGMNPVTGPEFGPPGMETDLLYIGGLVLLALGTGAGALSVDGWLASMRRRFGKA